MAAYLSPSSSTVTSYNVVVNGITIKTRVATSVSVADAAIDEMKSLLAFNLKKVVGLNCEWRPYDDGQPPNKVATLLLRTENQCVIVQLFYLESIPGSLRTFLSDHDVTFVGVRVGDDAEKLRNDYGLSVCKTTNVDELALDMGHGKFTSRIKPRLGLKDFAWEVASIRMKKPRHVSRSDWQVRTSDPQ